MLPKQTTTFADPDNWLNIDADVTPLEAPRRYQYSHESNWRAAAAFLISVSPYLSGYVPVPLGHEDQLTMDASMAKAVDPSISLSSGIQHVYDVRCPSAISSFAVQLLTLLQINYLDGFTSTYWALSRFFPAKETLLEACIYDDVYMMDGVEYVNDGERASTKISGTEDETK